MMVPDTEMAELGYGDPGGPGKYLTGSASPFGDLGARVSILLG